MQEVRTLEDQIIDELAKIEVGMSNQEVSEVLIRLKSDIPDEYEPEEIFSREARLKSNELIRLTFIKLDSIAAVKYYEEILKLSKNLNSKLYSERSLADIFASFKTYGDTTYRLESQWDYSLGILDDKGVLVGFVQANLEEVKTGNASDFQMGVPPKLYVSLIAVDEQRFQGIGLGANLYYALADLVHDDFIIKGATAAPLENKRIQNWYTSLGFDLDWSNTYGKVHKMVPFTGIPVKIKQSVLDYFSKYKKNLNAEIKEQ